MARVWRSSVFFSVAESNSLPIKQRQYPNRSSRLERMLIERILLKMNSLHSASHVTFCNCSFVWKIYRFRPSITSFNETPNSES